MVTAVRHTGRAATHLQTRAVQVDQETGDLLLGSAFGLLHVGRSKQYDEVGHVGMADEMLAAIDQVVAAPALGAGQHAAHVGAGIGLGHRQAVVAFASDRRQQVLADLVAGAGAQDVARPRHQHLQHGKGVGQWHRAGQRPVEACHKQNKGEKGANGLAHSDYCVVSRLLEEVNSLDLP